MTREEEIDKAAKGCVNNCTELSNRYSIEENDLEDFFVEGAIWADNNPKSPWISVKEDLPCNHKELINPNFKKETLLVLAITPSGYAFFDYMVYTNVWFWKNRNYCHAYWFPIPELPKE